MSIQYASQAQLVAANSTVAKLADQLQLIVQGSQRPSRVTAARITELDALVTAANVAIDAIIAAAVDNTPTALTFIDITGAVVSTDYVSNTAVASGFSDNVPVTITVSGGSYSVNNGPFVTAAGSVVLGDNIRAKGRSSASGATAVNVVVTIGGVADTFTITTA